MSLFRPVWPILVLLLMALFSQCASPPPVVPKPEPPVVIVPPPVEVDDDHRLVSQAEFASSPWKPLGAITEVVREGNAFALTLADGRVASLSFLTSSNFRLWFPPAPDSGPASPGPRSWPTGAVDVRLVTSPEALEFTTSTLLLTLDRTSLAWSVRVGPATVFRTPSGPLAYKRRLIQPISLAGAPLWSGLGSAGQGLNKVGQAVKLWMRGDNSDASGPWPVPFLLGSGGVVPMGLLVDNSYQGYVSLSPDAPSVGTLNGGLDLVFWTGRTVSDVVQGLTGLVGRPLRAPDAAVSTGLVMAAPETGLFARGARLSIGQAVTPSLTNEGRAALNAAHFWTVEAAKPVLEPGFDPTLPPSKDLRDPGPTALPELYPPTDWNLRFADQGRNSLLARVGNSWATSLVGLWARSTKPSPSQRPWLTWTTGSTGSGRWGAPEIRARAGSDDRIWMERLFSAGLSGLGSAQLRLDVRPLADQATSAPAWRSLQAALLVPYLILDAGPDPQTWWNSLSTKDKKQFKSMLDRRSTLKPALVAAAAQTSVTGAPAVRPLLWHYPTDPKARAQTDEFLLGDGILVAPALDGNTTRKVYFPGGGVWFQFPAGDEYGGGQTYDLPVGADFPLVFVKAGSFTPTREAEVYDDKATYNPMTYHVYPGAAGAGLYSVDDGVSTDRDRGLQATVNLAFSARANTMQIATEVETAGPRMKYSDPYVLLRLHKVYNPKSVKIDGKVIPKYGDSFGITDTDRSAAWYESDNTLLIKLFAPDKAQTIDLEFAKTPPGP